MKVLHIFNDGPCDDAQFVIDLQTDDHTTLIVDLSKRDVDYDELVEQIDQCDRVISW